MHFLLSALLASSTAHAITPTTSTVSWSQLGHTAAVEDAQPRGPGLLRAGADGRLLLYDGVRREVVILEGDRPALAFPVRHASDLAFVDDGVLVLDHAARSVSLWSLDGTQRSQRELGPLVPTSVGLRVEGDQVLARDVFGNGHPAATLRGGELEAPVARGLQQRAGAGGWDAGVMRTEGLQLELPHALEASGQRFGDWLVVDVVVADAPIAVERTAWHIPSRQAFELPVEGRLYAPRGDVAATPEGDLVVIVPRDRGLEILRVSP